MAVDLGQSRTGIAVSDRDEGFAFPKEVIHEKQPNRLIERVTAAAVQYGAELLVVGYPKNMDGSEGFKAQECAGLSQKLAAATGLETVLWDERVTTVMAHSMLNDTNTRGAKRKAVVDSVAATVLLESYLNFRKKRLPQ